MNIFKSIAIKLVNLTKLNRLLKLAEEADKAAHIGNLITNNGTVLLPECSVINMQNDSSKIILGNGTFLRGELQVYSYGGEIIIGENCYVGLGCKVWSGDSIKIGNNVLIGHNVNIIDFSHKAEAAQRSEAFKNMINTGHPLEKGNIPTRPIVIEDDVIIYAGSNIIMGVTIGRGSVISAGSVVIKDVPPFSLVLGNPAKVVWKTK